MGMDIIEATKRNNLDKVRQLLQEYDGICCSTVDDCGRNALHWATEFGYSHITRILLTSLDVEGRGGEGRGGEKEGGGGGVAGAEVRRDSPSSSHLSPLLDMQDSKGQTALHIACNTKREDVACLLVSVGSSLAIADKLGNTPLHRAVRMNLETAACMMCELGADVNARNAAAWTPLHEAARVGNETVLYRLIKDGADLDAPTDNRMTPFLTAFFYFKIASKCNAYPNLDVVWKLLIDSGCCLSKGDGHWTPLTAAISCDNSFIASLLLLNGCKVDKRGRHGRSIIQDVFICSEPTLVKLIVLLGCIPSLEEINYCSKQLPMYSKCFVRLPGLASVIHKERHEVVRWLKETQFKPPTLKLCCRAVIRSAMNVASGDKSIIANIQCLPIPNSLKRYLALSDFVHDFSLSQSQYS